MYRSFLRFVLSRPGQFMAQGLLLSMSVVYGSSLAVSLFLANAGSAALPVFYLLFAALSIPLSLLFSGCIDRWPRRIILAAVMIVYMVAAPLASLSLSLGAAGCFLLYCVASICEQMLYGVFYIFLGDYFTVIENKRISGQVTIALAAGAMLGAGLVSLATHLVAPRTAYLALPVLVLATLAHLFWLTRREAPLDECESAAEDGIWDSLKSLPSLSRRHPIVLAMAAAMFANVSVLCLMEYEAFSLYTVSYPDEATLAPFMAMMGAAVEVIGVLLVFCLFEPLVPRLGVARMTLIPPAINLASFAVLALAPCLASGMLAHVNYSPLKYSLSAPLFALIYNAVPHRFAGRVRVINDGVVYPLALAVSGGLLLAVQQGLSLSQVALIGLVLALLYGAAQWGVGRQYLHSLMEMLRNGAVELDKVGRGLKLPDEYQADIRTMLDSNQPDDVAMGLELAIRSDVALSVKAVERALPLLSVDLARHILEPLAVSGQGQGLFTALSTAKTAVVRARALEAMALGPRHAAQAVARRLSSDPDDSVRAAALALLDPGALPSGLGEDAALTALCVLRSLRAQRLPGGLTGHPAPRVRAEALAVLAAMGAAAENLDLAMALSTDADAGVRANAVTLAVRLIDDAELSALADRAFSDPQPEVRRAVALAAGRRGGAGLLWLAGQLRQSEGEAVGALLDGLAAAGGKAADGILFDWLSDRVFPRVEQALAALRRLPARRPAWEPLRLALDDEIAAAVQTVLRALSALGYNRVLTLVRIALKSDDVRARANALETLSSLEHRHYVAPLLPFLERRDSARSDLAFSLDDARALLVELFGSASPYIQAAALGAWRAEFTPPPPVETAALAPLALETVRCQNASPVPACYDPVCYDKDVPMNRLAFLKSVPLFSEMTLDQLLAVDGAMERESFLPGEVIVAEGDVGDKLYLLAEGAVVVRKGMPDGGQKELARLSPGQLFGEMALFDDDRRSASVAALDATLLLSLSRQRFHSLARQQPDLPLQICKVLVGRLRQAIA